MGESKIVRKGAGGLSINGVENSYTVATGETISKGDFVINNGDGTVSRAYSSDPDYSIATLTNSYNAPISGGANTHCNLTEDLAIVVSISTNTLNLYGVNLFSDGSVTFSNINSTLTDCKAGDGFYITKLTSSTFLVAYPDLSNNVKVALCEINGDNITVLDTATKASSVNDLAIGRVSSNKAVVSYTNVSGWEPTAFTVNESSGSISLGPNYVIGTFDVNNDGNGIGFIDPDVSTSYTGYGLVVYSKSINDVMYGSRITTGVTSGTTLSIGIDVALEAGQTADYSRGRSFVFSTQANTPVLTVVWNHAGSGTIQEVVISSSTISPQTSRDIEAVAMPYYSVDEDHIYQAGNSRIERYTTYSLSDSFIYYNADFSGVSGVLSKKDNHIFAGNSTIKVISGVITKYSDYVAKTGGLETETITVIEPNY